MHSEAGLLIRPEEWNNISTVVCAREEEMCNLWLLSYDATVSDENICMCSNLSGQVSSRFNVDAFAITSASVINNCELA
jgi:hypothetical protein